ncbi:transketolase C-terminal domain-containing protein [Halobacteriovorax sp. GB3]|uniref:transketolase family protein n=1 Tax=Halobacteriovorax sp. GB3 TaxID=2719615 RepID=UPI002360F4F4|nr:transketolase C-terminal domain-containing protein [Halobacteriovorax sp. GB3]MDD0852520.1 transketolase C-terminal domain-containing protein [Halobacteriovorax sp. GB3]
MRDAFIEKLSELAKKDSKVILVTGDLGFGVFDKFREELPDQFINAGIAEQNMLGLATGLALEGFKVFVYSIANFSTLRCLEQIRNDACYHDANLTVVSIGGGFSYGALGMSHHATEDLSIMRSFPMGVYAPTDLNEVKHITEHLVNSKGTSYLRLDKTNAPVDRDFSQYKTNEPQLVRKGSDVCFVTCGGICLDVLEAAESLEKNHNLTSSVYTIPDLNNVETEQWLSDVAKHKALITVEENTVVGGLGGLVAEKWMESSHDKIPFRRIGMKEGFSSIVGSQPYLKAHYKMDAKEIEKVALELL